MRRWLPLARLGLFALLLSLACDALGQELDAIPTPEELQAAEREGRAPIVIEEPADGARVAIPFTVSGTAPPAARLELWVGDSLERVFQSDATGRFTTPVNRAGEPDSKVFVHQVGGRGRRVQSASVAVVWGGAAPVKETTTAASPVANPASEAEPADAAAAPPSSDPILKTEPVDLAELDRAPPPPPVDQALTGATGADPPPSTETETEDSAVDEPDIQSYETTPYVYERPPRSRVARALLEVLTGGLGGVIGSVVGASIGFGTGLLLTGDPFAGALFGVLGGGAGFLVGVPLGVVIVGNVMDGNGRVWATVAGELGGLLAGVALAIALGNIVADPALPQLIVFTFPIVGAVLGYELSSDPSARAAKRATGSATLAPVVLPRHDNKPAAGVGLTIRF